MFGLGLTLNAIVCGVNGSSMPVQVPIGFDGGNGTGCPIDPQDWIHHCMTAQTHLKILADWIAIRGVGIASIGDLFEWAGDALQIPGFIACVVCAFKDGLFHKK